MLSYIKWILVLVICLSCTLGGTNGNGLTRIGYYRFQSLSDHSVLTATRKGKPKEVITDRWQETGIQEWRIRPLGGDLFIIRNEFVPKTEVEVARKATANLNSSEEPVIWNFLPVDTKPGVFHIVNNYGCLTNTGSGERVTVGPCNISDTAQQWDFEYLYASDL